MNHYNLITNKDYEGKNQVSLILYAQKMGFKSFTWGTFLQWKEAGYQVKKGSHGIGVFKGFRDFERKNKEGKILVESRPLGFATVFNEDQVIRP